MKQVVAIEGGAELEVDLDLGASPDPRSGLFGYSDEVDALPHPVRDAVMDGALAGMSEARSEGLIGVVDEIYLVRVTLRGEAPPDALRAAMQWAYADAAKACREYNWVEDYGVQSPSTHQAACAAAIEERAKDV